MELCSLGMGGVADPKIHAPPRHVLPRQIWYSFATNGVYA